MNKPGKLPIKPPQNGMLFLKTPITLWLGFFLLFSSAIANGQNINISEGVQKYDSLTGATVNMSGKCELWVTNATTPLSGCTVNLNSVDSYLVLPNVKPSVVASSYLNQIFINGGAAVADSNCRVVEYAMGAIVVPHPSNFQPLTIYSGPNFTGASTTLGQWDFYKSNLGLMYANISSFKLKRGYMAVMAQAENGMGVSKCYIAQDGDMEISILPAALDHNIRFIRVTPWRWTSKKGTAGWPGNVIMPSVQSWYNWRNISSSTPDLEYTAMQWGLFLPNLDSNDWQSEQVNTILGYNEPDHTDQSSLSVSDGIASWPKLQAAGLRLGSPATAEGGDWWFSPFMSQADAANLRVDFVAIHDYACHNPADPSGAATQLYNYLKNYYDTYKRPIWLTEWNSGANWTTCGDPTSAQEQALIAAMINMLDNTPWVERYFIYNWVEASRAVVDGSGNLTLAGQTYAAQQSPIGYLQALQDNGTRGFTELAFETNVLDSSGYGNNGIAAGSPAYTNGVHGQAIVFDGTNTVVTLPPNIATSSGFTFAAWVNWSGGPIWQRIFDFGNSASEYMFLTPSASTGKIRFAIKDINLTEQNFDAGTMPINQWIHLAVTVNGTTAVIYTNGVQAASASISFKPSDFNPRINTLGRSQFYTPPNNDPLFQGMMDDVFIADNALTPTAIAELVTNTPPLFANRLIDGGFATQDVPYSGSIAGAATDADGQAVGYSKVSGPAWLNIGSDGTMTGTPTAADGGTNYFTVTASDSAGGGPGQHSYAVVQIVVALAGNVNSAVWGLDGSTNWGTATAWTNGDPPSGPGQTADFSKVNLSANRTVTLDTSRTIGSLLFSDPSGSQSWTLASSGSSTLTLDGGGSACPTIAATNSVIISAPVAGTNGFNKTGPGTLTLSGNDLYLSGNVNIGQGVVTVGSTYALGTGLVTMSGGAISNASGFFTADNRINLVSDATFGIASGASLTLSGVITNGGSLVKEGNGTLMLAGASTYTGNTVLNAGTLNIGDYGSTPLGYSTLVINGGSLDNTVIRQAPLAGNNPQIWNGDFSFVGTQNLDLGAGPVTPVGMRQVTVNANTLLIGGAIGGSGGIIKAGPGILYLYGTSTYSGGTILNAGELQVANSQVLGSGLLTINGGTLSARLGNRTLGNEVTVGGDFTLGGVNGGANILTLTGNVDLGGSLRTITVDESGGAVISGQVSNGGIIKSGASTLTLAGANTYFGDTTVNAGVLAVSQPNLPTNAVVTVATNAILNLNFAGTNGVAGLVLNGVAQASGVYNASNSSPYLAGTGNLLVASSAPAAPLGLAAAAGNNQVTLNWSASSTATSYNVKRATTSGGPYTTIGNVTTTSYTDSGLVNDTAYYYVVSALNSSGESADSAEVNATPFAVPVATATLPGTSLVNAVGPTLVTSANFNMSGGNAVALLLTFEGFNAGDVVGATFGGQPMILGVSTNFGIEWSGIFYLLNPTTTSGQFAITTTGTNSSDGGYSAISIANVGGVASSSAAANSATSGTISLNYTVHTNAGFVVAACVNNGWNSSFPPPSFVSGNANQTLFGPVIIDSNDGNLHAYGAVSGAGNYTDVYGNPYQRNAYVTLAFDGLVANSNSVPAAPTGLAANVGGCVTYLNWSAASGAATYNVKRATVSGGPYTAIQTGVSATGFTDNSVTNGVTYFYVVSGVNTAGEGPDSPEASASPLPLVPSPWQTEDVGSVGLAGSAGYNNGLFTIYGSGSDIFGTADAFRYVYQSASGNCSIIGRVTSVQNTDPWAKAGVMIRESLVSGATHASVFLTPGSGVVFDQRSSTGAASTQTNIAGLTAPYWVQVVRSGNTFAASFSPDGVTWTNLGSANITMATNIYIGLAVTSRTNGILGRSTIDTVTAAPFLPPSAPAGLSATPGNAQVSLSWSTSSFSASYNVKRATVSGGPYTTLTNVTSTAFTDFTAANGTTYYYVVSALNGAGESANSAQVSATPSAPQVPAAPTNLTASSPQKRKITLNWTQSASGNITNNKIYRASANGGPYTLVTTIATGTTCSDTGLTSGAVYYYVVTAVNSSGIESVYSNQASATSK